jgi:transposase
MKLHGNARLAPHGRKLLVERVVGRQMSLQKAALSAGVSTRTASKWLSRYRAEGELGLYDRSSVAHSIPGRTPEQRVVTIAALRRLRMTAAEIAEVLGMPLSTVSAVLLRIGLGKRSRLEPPEPPNRYERARPGELIHIDVKKLGRIQGGAGKRVRGGLRKHYMPTATDAAGIRRKTVGWEYVHVCVDDATRLAYVEVLEDEKGHTVAGFLRRAVAHYTRYGITVERVMTDNGGGYRSAMHAIACRLAGVRHLRTRRTGHAQTARQNASSAPCSAAGHTARPTAHPPNAPAPSTAGSTTTIAYDHTAASANSHPSAASRS